MPMISRVGRAGRSCRHSAGSINQPSGSGRSRPGRCAQSDRWFHRKRDGKRLPGSIAKSRKLTEMFLKFGMCWKLIAASRRVQQGGEELMLNQDQVVFLARERMLACASSGD